MVTINKPVYFDEEEIAKACDELLASQAHFKDIPGPVGAQARLQQALMKEFNLACIREVNRNEDIEYLYSAVCCMFASFIVTVTESYAADKEVRSSLINHILEHTALGVLQILNGNVANGQFKFGRLVEGHEGGNA